MYLEYWGLKTFPFENVPDPDFMYLSPEHEEALARLLYAVRRNKGIVLVTGEIGSGKTTLSRALIKQLSDAKLHIGLMMNPVLDPVNFPKEILYSLGVMPDNDNHLQKSDYLNILYEMIKGNVTNGKTTLLIFDEAQLIPENILEDIRLLLNFQLNDKFMLTIVLLGQPELRSIIQNMKQLDQRVAIRFHLNPLSYEETLKYVAFRFKKAGLSRNIITRPAVDEIYNHSKGVPRLINNICDISLMMGFISKAEVVHSGIVKEAAQDSG